VGAPAPTASAGIIDYTDAPTHVGETASVRGTLVDAHASASGTVFLDFCKSYKTCPFTAVVFAGDAKKFGDLSKYAGQTVTLTGKISSYQGKAEIILSSPNQLTQ
jgi:exonuclease VII large subunit